MYTFYKREKIVNQSVVNCFQRKVQLFYRTTLDVLDASLHIFVLFMCTFESQNLPKMLSGNFTYYAFQCSHYTPR